MYYKIISENDKLFISHEVEEEINEYTPMEGEYKIKNGNFYKFKIVNFDSKPTMHDMIKILREEK